MEEDRQTGLLSSQPLMLLTNHVKELRKLWQAEARKNRQLSTVIGKAATLLRRQLTTQSESSRAYSSTLEALKLFEKDEPCRETPQVVLQYFDTFAASLHRMKLKSLRGVFKKVVEGPQINKIKVIRRLEYRTKRDAWVRWSLWMELGLRLDEQHVNFRQISACDVLGRLANHLNHKLVQQFWQKLIFKLPTDVSRALLALSRLHLPTLFQAFNKLKSIPSLSRSATRLVSSLKPLTDRILTRSFTTIRLYFPPYAADTAESTRRIESSYTAKNLQSHEAITTKSEALSHLLDRTIVSQKVFIKDSIAPNPYSTVNARVINRTLINEFSLSQLIRSVRSARHRAQLRTFYELKVWNLQSPDAEYRLKQASCLLIVRAIRTHEIVYAQWSFGAIRQAVRPRPSGFTAAAMLIRKELNAGLKRRLLEVVEIFKRMEKVEVSFKPKASQGSSAKLFMSYGRAILHKTLQKFADLSQTLSFRLAHIAIHRLYQATRPPSSRRSKIPRLLLKKTLERFARVVENRELRYSWKVMQLASYRQLLAVSLINVLDMLQDCSYRRVLAAFQQWRSASFRRPSSPYRLNALTRHISNLSPIEGNRPLITLPTSVFNSRLKSEQDSVSKDSQGSRLLPMPTSIHDYIDDIMSIGSQFEDTQFLYSDFEDSRELQVNDQLLSESQEHRSKPVDASLNHLQINLRGISKFRSPKLPPQEKSSRAPTEMRGATRQKFSARYSA